VSGQPRLVNVRHESFAGDLVVFAEVEKPGSDRLRLAPGRDSPSSWGASAELPQGQDAEQRLNTTAFSSLVDPT
jgi:hypothetical protein